MLNKSYNTWSDFAIQFETKYIRYEARANSIELVNVLVL